MTVSESAVSRSSIWARFARDRRGAVAVAVAVLLPVLVGFAGIGIEIGLWFAIQRQNQSAADAAAISAALEYAAQIQSGVATNPTAAATTAAGYNLFNNPNCSTSGTTNCTLYPCYDFSVGSSCNTSGSNGAPPSAVQVVLTQPLNTIFASFVTSIWGPSVNTVNVTTTAIAAFPQTSSACILALDPTEPNAVFVEGTVSNSNCWVASNSSSGSALNCNGCTITGPTTVVGGDAVSNNGHLNGSPNRTYASAVADPYPIPPGCSVVTGGFIAPGHYCDGIQLNSGDIYTMAPGGVYHIDKVFNISNRSRLIANGVTIVINIGGAMQVDANSTLYITAPSTSLIPILEVYLAS